MSVELLCDVECLGDLFVTVCNFKQNIVKLKSEELANFKRTFYSLDFPKWQLNLLWEMIWGDRIGFDVICILSHKKLLKAGDVIGKINRFKEEENNC